ncbi:MAG: ATP-binding protein [Planctomycetales bacterium 71-10]|nr:MAG: ATP-binding protein [Planctomycetales bacterium 71-10]
MLSRLTLRNFTVFADADFRLCSGLNVVIGENGAGKSHALKAAYCVQSVVSPLKRDALPPAPTKKYLEGEIARKLRRVFRPEELGRLASRRKGRSRCEVEAVFEPKSHPLSFHFNTNSKSEVNVISLPRRWADHPPVFLPSRELLSIYPGFVSLYETTDLEIEETWRDTCLLLGVPATRGVRPRPLEGLATPLEEELGGKVVLGRNDRFYVETPAGDLEAHLVAEGLRKLAMIARLIATRSLVGAGSLYWDEPEANLNPKVIKLVARTILGLCAAGIQVFVATHSLFLLRELDILAGGAEFADVETRFIGLHPAPGGVALEQGESIDDVGDIDSLSEELSQSDRYLAQGVR